jgi:ubiquitin-conjugating enzyme E2 W
MNFMRDPIPGMSIDTSTATDGNLSVWIINVTGAPNTLYAGERYKLQFKFPSRYPFDSPSVMFIGNTPVHPHIYSNGHICLSILTDEWSPALSVQAVCLSILSMLSSCKEKVLPPDNDRYVATCRDPNDPKKTKWFFHDDNV